MQTTINDAGAAGLVADLGFLVHRDVPTDDAEAELIIALRRAPTERHFDPELLTYWKIDELGRGRPGAIMVDKGMPIDRDFGWGAIEIVDRLGASNAFLGFGGRLHAFRMDDGTVIAHFTSPAPILPRGGHSQQYDGVAGEIGGFFARLLVRIDFRPGAEAAINSAGPAVLYAAFLQHDVARLTNERVRELYHTDARFVTVDAERVRRRDPEAWARAADLLRLLELT
jgi:hypothetical protein